MASSPYYHADAAMMDADYAQPETEEIDMDDGVAPEYEMADDDTYYQPYPQPAAPDADIVDATDDAPPQDAPGMPPVVPAPEMAVASVPLDQPVPELAPAPAFSEEAAPAPGPVFPFADVPSVDAFQAVPPQEIPEHVSPLPLPASDLPAEHPEAPAEPALPHAPVEPAPSTDEAAAPVEDESPSHETHPEHPVSFVEEAAVAPEPEPTAEAHATSETVPDSESHAHDAPPPQDPVGSAHEAAPAAESHVYEASAPGEVTLVEDPTAYELYEDDLDEGSDPSDEDAFIPAPTVSMSVQNDPAAHYVLFELAENASSSTTTFLFSDRPNLYYEPVSAVFEALRQIDTFASKYEYCELALFAQQLNLTIAEDSKHASEVSFSDFALLHDSFGLDGPLQMQLQSITPRFIKRFNFLRAEVAKMMRDPSATSQAAFEPEASEAAPPEQQEQLAGYYESEEAAPAAHLEAQAEAHSETDEPRAEEPHAEPIDEAAEESGYAEDDEAELEYEDLPQEYHAAGQEYQEDQQDAEVAHADDDGAADDNDDSNEVAEAGDHEGEPVAAADGLYEAPAQLERAASEHGESIPAEQDASEYGEPVAPFDHGASDHGDVTAPAAEAGGDQVDEETSGEGDEDEDYSQEYAEYEGEYDEDDEGEDAEVHQLDDFADDTNPPQAQEAYATNPDEVHEFLQGIISEVAVPESSAEHHEDDYHEEEPVQPQEIIDLTGDLAPSTNSAKSAPEVYDLGDGDAYSAIQSSYEGGEIYDLDADPEQEPVEAQAYDVDADAAYAYEEDDQATLSSSDDRAAHTLPSISSKRSHDELLREDPEFDGDGLGEDDHDSKRARVE